MIFLTIILLMVTLLLCYAGYVFLVVDRRSEAAVLDDPDLFDALDDKNYNFELPAEVETYEDLRLTEPTDKCAPARRPPVLPAAARARSRSLAPRTARRSVERGALCGGPGNGVWPPEFLAPVHVREPGDRRRRDRCVQARVPLGRSCAPRRGLGSRHPRRGNAQRHAEVGGAWCPPFVNPPRMCHPPP